jgi:hypothetical protein
MIQRWNSLPGKTGQGRWPARPAARQAWLVVCCAAVGGPAAPAVATEIDGRITRVGLFAGARPAIRVGAWSFAEVELRHRGAAPFDGQLVVEQPDRDGDIARSVLPVALAPNSDWRPYQVYFVPNSGAEASYLRIRLLDATGRQMRLVDETGVEVIELTGPVVDEVPSEQYLIVDLSTPRRLEHVALLDAEMRRQSNELNARQCRGMTPRELPSRPIGLDAVDAITWDDADASAISPQQAEALAGWVRAGGRLLLSGGKNWQTLTAAPMSDLLPVTITGLVEDREAQEFIERVVRSESYGGWLERQYLKRPFLRCVATARPGAMSIPDRCESTPLAFRQLLGRGSVVFLCVPLRQLFPPPAKLEKAEELEDPGLAKEDDFLGVACDRVLASRLLALPEVRDHPFDSMAMVRMARPLDLFDAVRRSIGFESVGASFLVFAVLFAAAYTLLATVGTHWYMKRRGWLQQSWSAFAVVSLAASAAGTGMVWLLRGFTDRLWQTTVVDGHAGRTEAQATVLLGLKAHAHRRLDLRLPAGEAVEGAAEPTGPLRVMPQAGLLEDQFSRFVSPEQYDSVLAGTGLEDLPIRATLKEFEAYWQGPLPGTIEGRLVAVRSGGEGAPRWEFGEGSYLRNHLGVDLKECVLLATEEEIAGENPVATAVCLFLGDLPASGPGSSLEGDALARRLYDEPAGAEGGQRRRRERLPLLSEEIGSWASGVRPMLARFGQSEPAATAPGMQEYTALLLLSTFNQIKKGGDARGVDSFTRSLGRRLDCTHQLTRRSALLMGYSEAPPPMALEADRVALRPEKARTIYRFVIPVEGR